MTGERYITSKRWLGMGFLNHQQYVSNVELYKIIIIYIYIYVYTLSETNCSHTKMDGLNISFLLGPGLFSGANC